MASPYGETTPMMPINNRKPVWSFYLEWVLLTAISIPVAWAIAWFIISRITQAVGGTIQVGGVSHITEDFIGGFVFLPVLGLLIGVVQYLLLRGYLPRMSSWVPATVLGWMLPLVLLYLSSTGLFPDLAFDPVWSGAIAFTIIGASIGLCQWSVLRERISRAALWPVASVLGWSVAGLAVGEVISTQLDVIAIALLPPTAASIAWWLLLDKLPSKVGNGRDTPAGNYRAT